MQFLGSVDVGGCWSSGRIVDGSSVAEALSHARSSLCFFH